MQFKKIKRHLPIWTMTAGLILATSTIYSNSLNNYQTESAIFQSQSDNVQIVDSVSDIKIVTSSMSAVGYAIVKDPINGDRLYGWGWNRNGMLGIGIESADNLQRILYPTQCLFVDLPPRSTITSVTSGFSFTAVIINGTELYMAGSDSSGEQGNGYESSKNVLKFTRNVPISNIGKTITNIALGNRHIILIVDGKWYAWGSNYSGQLGNGTIVDKIETPEIITGVRGTIIHSIVATNSNTYVWADDNIYAWGSARNGSIGIDNLTDNVITPMLVPLPDEGPITAFSAGQFALSDSSEGSSCLVVLGKSKLYGWGLNNNGQLGNNSSTNAMTPTEANLDHINFGSNEIEDVHNDGWSSWLKIGNALYAAGSNAYGQLGTDENTEAYTSVFSKCSNYNGYNDSTTYSFTYAGVMANTNGVISYWGSNSMGILANGTTEPTRSAEPLPFDAFGLPSTIVSKDKNITASAALETFWDGHTLDLTALDEYVTINLSPVGTTFSKTPVGSPVADDSARKITFSIKASQDYFSYPDGAKTSSTTPVDVVIDLYSDCKTNISVLDFYPQNIYIDDWIKYVTVDGIVNPDRLAEFLILSDVPIDAKYQIEIISQDNNTGILICNINTSKWITMQDRVEDSMSPDFKVTLQLKPKTSEPLPAEEVFPWWWILVGIGGAAVAGLGVWFFLKKRNGGYGRTTKRR